jgi:hypothetical protein
MHRAAPILAWQVAALIAAGMGLALMVAPGAALAVEQRRFALVMGNDRGGPDTRPLLFAAEDARKVHAVLTELAGVAPRDALLVVNRTAADARAALSELQRRAAAARTRGEQTVLFLYFSGHAKDGELRLGDSRLPLDEIKQHLVTTAAADIRVGILDSCRSGAITRAKGARHVPAFEIDASSADGTQGRVLLTSSSSNEDSQESDEIRGSYFSHHLVSGLRGGADRSRDGRVTLTEAYAYAYSRTVADTAVSSAGTQHPTFSYDLKGNGDLVLTEVMRSRAGVYLPREAPAGTYYLVHREGFVAAELVKPAGEDRRIALTPGRYTVRRRLPDRLRVGEVQLSAGELVTLDESTMKDAPFSDDPIKGSQSRQSFLRLGLGVTGQAFAKESTRSSMFPPTPLVSVELAWHDFLRRGWIWAFDLELGSSQSKVSSEAGGEVPFKFAEATLGTSLLVEWSFLHGDLRPFLGGRLAFMRMTREFAAATALPKQSLATVSPGLVLGASYALTRRLRLSGTLRLHSFHYTVEDDKAIGYSESGLLLSYDF